MLICQEYLNVNKSTLPVAGPSSPVEASRLSLMGTRDSMQDLTESGTDDKAAELPRVTSDVSIYGIDVAREEEKLMIDTLARHIVFSES